MSRVACGFCETDTHDRCNRQIVFYDKIWYCHCEKCKDKPRDKKDKNEKPNSQDILPEPTTDSPARTGDSIQEPEPEQPKVETEDTNEVAK
jgi:hypothetical protein